MAKNLATDSTAHVHQLQPSGGQDGAVQHAGNVDSDIANMIKVSLHCLVMDRLFIRHISAFSHGYHYYYLPLSSFTSCLIEHQNRATESRMAHVGRGW